MRFAIRPPVRAGTIDSEANTVTFTTDSLSPFVLGVPEPSTWALAMIGIVAIAVGRWRRPLATKGFKEERPPARAPRSS